MGLIPQSFSRAIKVGPKKKGHMEGRDLVIENYVGKGYESSEKDMAIFIC